LLKNLTFCRLPILKLIVDKLRNHNYIHVNIKNCSDNLKEKIHLLVQHTNSSKHPNLTAWKFCFVIIMQITNTKALPKSSASTSSTKQVRTAADEYSVNLTQQGRADTSAIADCFPGCAAQIPTSADQQTLPAQKLKSAPRSFPALWKLLILLSASSPSKTKLRFSLPHFVMGRWNG